MSSTAREHTPDEKGAEAPPQELVRATEGFTNAEIGAVAHLYRGEVYRSTIWRTRLDATTNWSVVSLGIALSISYASPQATSLPLLLVAVLISVFLYLEARRYRYFNVWRARARWMEINFYSPLLRQRPGADPAWRDTLANDYERPEHHISFRRALGRRLRRNYVWIFTVQVLAYLAKASVHPTPAANRSEFLERMAVGAIPGSTVFVVLVGGYLGILGFTAWVYSSDRRRLRDRPNPISMG